MGEQVAAGLKKRGRSSVGRAPALQAGGQEFESLRLHDRWAEPHLWQGNENNEGL